MSVKNKESRSGLKWKKYPALFTAAALAASLSCSMVSLAATTSYYDWDAGADKTVQEIYNRVAEEMEAYYGPGMIRVESEVEAAPVVNESNLSEQYHSDYQIYEESLAGRFFFYSSVANGGITHEAVTLDMPANLIYSFEKDGSPWSWTPGQKISAYGTYVMSITAVEDTSLPLSEQVEYNAVFRFRIQEKPPEPETEAGEAYPEDMGYGTGNQTYYPDGNVPFGMESEVTQEIEESSEAAELELPADGTGEGEGSGDGESAEDAESTDNTDNTDNTDQEVSAEPIVLVPRIQEYDDGSNQYLVTLENGYQLVSTIPEGYVGPRNVQVTVAEEQSDLVKVYCDDAEIEYVRGNQFTEPGQYRVVLDGYAYSFTISSYVNHISQYPAPAGMTFTSCTIDGEKVELESERYVTMDRDGEYHLTMEGEAGEVLEVTLKKDTSAPQFTVNIKSGTANVQYLTDDTALIELTKDGKPVEKFGGYTISTPGKYTLTVTDHAGNSTAQDFTLNYQVNGYGIAAVVLVIVLIAGVAAFVVRTKKSITIR